MDNALQFFPIMVVGFAMSLGLTPLSRQVAFRLGVVDRPTSARKAGAEYKPLMGGMAMYLAFSVALLTFAPPRHFKELAAIVAGATVLAVVGLWDDRYDLGLKPKLAAMVLVALGLVSAGIQVRLFKVIWLDAPLTVFWMVAIMNAVNFLDNMDGLAAGLSAIAAFFFMLIAFLQGQVLVSSLAAAIFGSALGFLVYNFNPASTFMGDMGALVLGLILAVLGVKLTFAVQPLSVTWMIPILVLALPVFDINLVVFTRLSEGRSPGQAGKDHTSHRLRSMGFSTRATLLILYTFCTLYGLMAVLVSEAPPAVAARVGFAGLILLGINFVLMMVARRVYQLNPERTTT
jgi:UDP-GlcNAc:undecaprenyl-phosphate GlcNAc-1-phosphate transferase